MMRCQGMIRCAFPEMRKPARSMPRCSRPSSSSISTSGSITQPLPITHSVPGQRMPLGTSRSL